MGSDAELLRPSDNLDGPELPIHQQIQRVLVDAIEGAELGTAAVLEQFEDEASAGPLLCTLSLQQKYGAAQHAWQMPDFDSVGWYGQAMASLAAAMVLESQAQDLVTAANQLLLMFLPGVPYQRNQLQQSRRSMAVLVRSLRLCLTSEGQQAVLAAIICLLVLQTFLDSTAALQAVTKEAVAGLKKNRSGSSQLAAWAVTHLVLRGEPECSTIALSAVLIQVQPKVSTGVVTAGGVEVVVDQLRVSTQVALQSLGVMADVHAGVVWAALLKLSGLAEMVEYTKSMDLQEDEGVLALGSIIVGLHKLLEHPQPTNQATVLQELRTSGILDLFFICAKSEVPQVSQPAVNCLVLIWQWYLRRSPTASFSIDKMSCCFPEEPTPTAEGAAATAVVIGQQDSTTAVAKGGGQPDPSQLWSVMPVVDYAIDRACDAEHGSHHDAVESTAGATASQRETGKASSHSLRFSIDSSIGSRRPLRSSTSLRLSTDLSPDPRVLPVRSSTDAGPNLGKPPVRAPPPPITPAEVRVSAGSLPAFHSSPKAVLAAPMPASSASEQPAPEQAPTACLNSLLASTKPRVASAAVSAATPVGGGQFVHQPHDWLSAASSSWAQQPSVNQQNLAASTSNAAGDLSGKLPNQLTRLTSLTASKNQQACRHSLSSPESRHVSCSMHSPSLSGSYREVKEAPITPDQLAGHFSRMRIDVEDIPQSSSSLSAAASKIPRAEQAGALDHTWPEGFSRQYSRDYWAPPQPAKAEGHDMQCYGGLERQSPAASPPIPDHRKPTKRVLHFSPLPVMQSQGHGSQSILGTVADPQVTYLAKGEHGRNPLPLHEDSAWDAFDPQVAWSASASSLVTTSGLDSRTSSDIHTHSGDQLFAGGHKGAPAQIDDVNLACFRHDKPHDDGKESRMSRFLHWLTDPDSRDLRRSKKTGLPVVKGPLYSLADATGRCPV